MSDELRELYPEMIIDHGKKPRNRRALPTANRNAEGVNSLCGDRITVHIHVEDDVIQEVTFEGSGCTISTASASMMTESLKGKTVKEVRELFSSFHKMVTQGSDDPASMGLGKLAVLCGVREFPVRVKCATLAWHTLTAALEEKNEIVSTE